MLKDTLYTIRFISETLAARYSSASAQTLLTQMIGRTTKCLRGRYPDLMVKCGSGVAGYSPPNIGNAAVDDVEAVAAPYGSSTGEKTRDPHSNDYVLATVRALLGIIATVAHPDSIDNAKKAVEAIREQYKEFYYLHRHAVMVLDIMSTL